MKKIIILTALLAMTLACQSNTTANSLKEKGLELSWSLNKNSKTLELRLLNISDHKISVRAPKEYFEATIIVTGKKKLEFHEKRFQRMLFTGLWHPEDTDLEPNKSVKWSIKFDDILPCEHQGESFVSAIKSGKVSIEKFWGFTSQ